MKPPYKVVKDDKGNYYAVDATGARVTTKRRIMAETSTDLKLLKKVSK